MKSIFYFNPSLPNFLDFFFEYPSYLSQKRKYNRRWQKPHESLVSYSASRVFLEFIKKITHYFKKPLGLIFKILPSFEELAQELKVFEQ